MIKEFIAGFGYASGAGAALLLFWIIFAVLGLYYNTVKNKMLIKSFKKAGLNVQKTTVDNLRKLDEEGRK